MPSRWKTTFKCIRAEHISNKNHSLNDELVEKFKDLSSKHDTSWSETDPVYREPGFGQASSLGSKKGGIRQETKEQNVPEVPRSQTCRFINRFLLPNIFYSQVVGNLYSHSPGHSPQVRGCYHIHSQYSGPKNTRNFPSSHWCWNCQGINHNILSRRQGFDQSASLMATARNGILLPQWFI